MPRTLLYYPTFVIPSIQWIKDGLLFWDDVGSIVPERFKHIVKSEHMDYLLDEGLYRRFDPEMLFKNEQNGSELAKDFK